MSRLLGLILVLATMIASASVLANVRVAPPDTADVPSALEPWVDWVLSKHPELACPVNYSDQERRCVWPSPLRLELSESGGQFTQTVQVFSRSRFILPGSLEQWPSAVTVNSRSAVVVNDQGRPAVDLEAGQWQLSGRFDWQRLPDSLVLSDTTGIVNALINGQQRARPDRRAGRLWLSGARTTEQSKAPSDALDLEVARLIEDGHPLKVTTAITLRVSGKQREIVLPRVLLANSIALSLSSRLPARLEPDGSLRVQVRPGTFRIEVTGRQLGQVGQLLSNPAVADWPAQEIWLWRSAPQIRLAEIVDAVQIDPRQASIPNGWANLPAYRMDAGDAFSIKTTRRGDPTPEPDQLSLKRDMWLDFDGQGLSVQDRLSGRLSRTWRLEANEPMALGQVRINNEAQFITTTDQSDRSGVEVRRGKLQMLADARIEPVNGAGGLSKTLPTVGWAHDFQTVSATLHTPPGWRVVSVSGVDSAPGAWLDAWTLYDLFLVLIIAVSIARLWGWPWALVAALMLTLLWHEPGAPRLVWLAALVPIALLRVVPAGGKLAKSLGVLRAISLLLLVLVCLPFVIDQARTALHPQLEATHHASPVHRQPEALRHEVSGEPAVETSPQQDANAEVSSPQASKAGPRSRRGGSLSAPPPADKSLATLRRVDPDAVVQTGPGVPDWRWRTVKLTFNGPVLAQQSMSLRLLSPHMKQAAQVVMLLLLALLVWRLLEIKPSWVRRWRVEHVAAMVLALQLTPGEAAQFPSEQLLGELEQRLLKPQTNPPRAAIDTMRLSLSEQVLTLELSIKASATTAVPLPADIRRLMPSRVTMNDASTQARTLGDENGQLWLLVPAGEQKVKVQIPLPPVNQISLSLPLKPHRIKAELPGWTLGGIDENGVVRNQLTLTRVQQAGDGNTNKLETRELAPLLAVTRTVQMGLNWGVETRVRRLSPPGFPISMRIALLPGEQVISADVETRDAGVLVNMGGGDREFVWRSRLDPVDELTLTASNDANLNETWRLQASPIWRVSTNGIAPMFHQDASQRWLPTWKPWAGESVSVQVSRPAGIGGQSLTIEKSRLLVEPGIRATDSTLEFTVRSSQGAQHAISLPPGASLQSVTINGRAKPLRPNGSELVLPIVPGKQSVRLSWREDAGVDYHWQSPAVDLGTPHVNARLAVKFPKDRWTLWTSGPRLGPAVLIWGVLAVLLVLSIALARASRERVPLGVVSWFLLAVGLSQVTVFAWMLVVVWLFLLAARPHFAPKLDPWSHNGVQIGIAALTVVSLGILLWAVQQGLLGRPEMQIAGYGSNANRLNWYMDRSDALLPNASVISAPLWVYRVLMLAWALWLAWSLLSWLQWGWRQFASGDLWRPTRGLLRKPKPDPDPQPGGPGASQRTAGTAQPNQQASEGSASAVEAAAVEDTRPADSPAPPRDNAQTASNSGGEKGDEGVSTTDLASLAAKALADKQNKRS